MLEGREQSRKRLLVMDDHFGIAEQIRVMLAPRHDVVAIADDVPVCLAVAKEHKPEAALLDVSMPRASGFTVAGLLLKLLPDTKIIFITQHSNPAYISAAREAGGSGYVLKRKISEDLQPALDEVLGGGEYISPCLKSPPPRSIYMGVERHPVPTTVTTKGGHCCATLAK